MDPVTAAQTLPGQFTQEPPEVERAARSQADSESRILSALPLIGPEQLKAPVTDPMGENPNMAASPDEDRQRFL